LFINLHLHSQYSVFDGTIEIDKLAEYLKDKAPGCAITDHGVMHGCVKFYKIFKKAGLKPILGSEMYITSVDKGTPYDKIPNKQSAKEERGIAKERYHIILLAKNNEGYSNLCRIVSEGHLRGYYYKPRIDLEVLKKYKEGIVVTSACIFGEVSNLLIKSVTEQEGEYYLKAKEVTKKFLDIFGDDYYLEVQDNGAKEQYIANPLISQLGEELSIPIVATSDSHYLKKEDIKTFALGMKMQTYDSAKKKSSYEVDMNMKLWVKTEEDFISELSIKKEYCDNTELVFNKCNVSLPLGTLKFPEVA